MLGAETTLIIIQTIQYSNKNIYYPGPKWFIWQIHARIPKTKIGRRILSNSCAQISSRLFDIKVQFKSGGIFSVAPVIN